MSATDLLEGALWKLMFNNANTGAQTPAVVIGDSTGLRGSSTAGNFFFALFQGDPLDAGSGATETTYTGYTRIAIARSTAGFTYSAGVVTNVAEILFALYGGGTVYDVSHGAICSAGTAGVNDLLVVGALSPAGAELTVGTGVQPRIAPGSWTATLD